MKVSREFSPLSCQKLHVHIQVNKTKFERNSSLEYYHMAYIAKLNIRAKEVYHSTYSERTGQTMC